ncbi:MAG TPA: hypothetical protein VK338_00545, partial [Candidatus Nitrosocosmicus sp.]|nr:hypothetical protein [Candidatus Nitrosocosmicus sp.]
PIFLHVLVAGGASHSYGVAVAKLAGIPDKITNRAYEILHELEKRDNNLNTTKKPEEENKILSELQKVDVNNMTPIEALNLLSKLKSKVRS